MAKTKFVSKKWSAALQHADVAMNCMKLLREKAEFSGLNVQNFALLPAVSPHSQDLPMSTDISLLHGISITIFSCAFADWMDGSFPLWPILRVVRSAPVLGRERVSEADLRLFSAVLRTLSLVDGDETNRSQLDNMPNAATLAGLHAFSLKFYKKLINYDGRESGEGSLFVIFAWGLSCDTCLPLMCNCNHLRAANILWNSVGSECSIRSSFVDFCTNPLSYSRLIFNHSIFSRWSSGVPGFIQVLHASMSHTVHSLIANRVAKRPNQVLESAFDIMVAIYQLPHGQAIDPEYDTVNKCGPSCDPLDASPEDFVRVCVLCIHR